MRGVATVVIVEAIVDDSVRVRTGVNGYFTARLALGAIPFVCVDALKVSIEDLQTLTFLRGNNCAVDHCLALSMLTQRRRRLY